MDGKFHIVRAREGEAWRLRLFGEFDGTSAWELRRVMSKLRRAAVMVDFSEVTELHDFGVAVLAAHFVSRRSQRVRFEGLDARGQALLRRHGLQADWRIERPAHPHPVLGFLEPPG